MKIMSLQLLPAQKPHCASWRSSSASLWSLSCSILVATFPTTSNREMPLQWSQLERSPFFGIGTRIMPSTRGATTLPDILYQLQQIAQKLLFTTGSLCHFWQNTRLSTRLAILHLPHSTQQLFLRLHFYHITSCWSLSHFPQLLHVKMTVDVEDFPEVPPSSLLLCFCCGTSITIFVLHYSCPYCHQPPPPSLDVPDTMPHYFATIPPSFSL